MRVFHTALMNEPFSGIYNQMLWEDSVAKELGLNWKTVLYVQKDTKNDTNIIKVDGLSNNWMSLRIGYYNWLYSQKENFDVLVLRHSISDPFQYFFLKKLKKPVYLVHHTLELQEILTITNFKSKIHYLNEKIFGSLSIREVKGIIGVTDEIFRYEASRGGNEKFRKIIYPNGIFFDNAILLDKRGSEIPEIIFIANNFSSWHGLDLVLKNIKNNKENFILHVIGNVSESDKLTTIDDNRVIFHGLLNQKDLKILMEKAWVGLASFGLYRLKMEEACTLKVREYLKNGIPVYSGYRDVFPDSFKFYRNSEFNMEYLLRFAHEMRMISRQEVSEAAKIYINKKELLNKLYFTIKEDLNFF